MKKKVVLDIETGEILNELENGDRILKKKSIDYLKNTIDVKEMTKVYNLNFVKLYESFFDIIGELNASELRVCLELFLNTRYKSGIIAYENGNVINSSDIAKKVEIDVRSSQRILKSLCDKEIICREKIGKGYVYYMNPFICVRGSSAYKSLVDKFKNSKFNKSK